MEKQKLALNALSNGVTAFIGNFSIDGSYVINGCIDLELSVNEYLMSVTNEDKVSSSLKMVMFENDKYSKIRNLSPVDKKKVQLAYALCKKEKYIFLEYFEKGLTTKEKDYFKKLFQKLKEYHITIIIHTNDINFFIGAVDKICLVKDNNVVTILSKNNWYNKEIYDYVSEPVIVEFINYCKRKGINIDNYMDNKEVIKAIFRLVS